MICDISLLSLTIRKAVTSVYPECPLLQFRFIAHHIHQGNPDRPVLSCSISLFLFLKSVTVIVFSFFFPRFSQSYIINHVFMKWAIFLTLFFLFLFFLILFLPDNLPVPNPYHNLILSLIIFSSEFHDFVTGLVLEFGLFIILLCLPAFVEDDPEVLKHCLSLWLEAECGLSAALLVRIS